MRKNIEYGEFIKKYKENHKTVMVKYCIRIKGDGEVIIILIII